MTTLESLQAKIQKLQTQADALIAKKSSAIIEKIRALMAEHGLTTADIDVHVGGKKRGPKPGAKSPVVAKTSAAAKYQDPKTGATWSGHGRAPGWIANAKGRSKFLVQDGAEATAAATVRTASKSKTAVKKASNGAGATGGRGQRKGPQPAMYQDPKSGATWSGRGRAPAWLAGAKDRSKFLIDGGAGTSAGAASKTKPSTKKPIAKKAVVKKVAATKTAPTKKVTAKKVVAKKSVSAKAPAKNAPRQSVAVPAPVAAVESGAELTT